MRLHLEEVRLTLAHRLGAAADTAKVNAVVDLFAQRYAAVPIVPPASLAATPRMEATRVASQFNEDASRFYNSIALALGPDAYQRVYNAASGGYVGLINPDSLAQSGAAAV